MMIVIDLKAEKVREFDAWGLCLFINDLIQNKDKDLLGKRYLFCPDEESAKYILVNLLKKSEDQNKILKQAEGEYLGTIH